MHWNFLNDVKRCCLLGVFLSAIVSPHSVRAAVEKSPLSSAEPANEEVEKIIPTAPVVIDGLTLFSVQGLPALPAENRAQRIADRIHALAEDKTFATQTLRFVEVPAGTEILGADRLIMLIADPDAHLEGVNRQVLTRNYLARIQEAIDAFRHERQPNLLTRHAMYALAALVVLIVGLWTGRIAVRRLDRAFERRYKEKMHDVSFQSFQLLSAKHVWRLLNDVLSLVWLIGALLAIYVCLHYILVLFPWTRGFATNLLAFFMTPLWTIGNALVKAIPELIFLAVLVVVTRYVLRLFRLFFSAVERESVVLSNFDPAWARPTYRLVRVLVIAFALVAAYPYIPGSNTEAFKGISLLIGVIFSLGSSSLIANMISGYSLTYRKAFKEGDRVKIGECVGDVQDSKLMVTHLRTIKNELVAVPNSKIIDEQVVNYSALAGSEGLILHTTVGIGYEVPWRQVESMLLEAAERTSGLLHEPKPFVRQIELGTFAVTYEINAYCDEPSAMSERYTTLHQNILDIFNEYGIQIMTPAYEGDPERAKIVPKDHWYPPPASALFHSVSKTGK
jgi:small-conductance mechanosensitive channel